MATKVSTEESNAKPVSVTQVSAVTAAPSALVAQFSAAKPSALPLSTAKPSANTAKPSNTVRMLIDTRERAGGLTLYNVVLNLLQESGMDTAVISSDDIKREQLLRGDFCFVKKVEGEWKLVLIVERKTVSDLQASFTDGRLEEQKADLLRLRQEEGIPFVYLVEGSLKRDVNERSRINAALLKDYIEQMEMESILVKRPKTKEKTCLILFRYLHALQRNAPIRGVAMRALANKSKNTPDMWWTHALALVPGVSLETADEIARAFPTQSKLISGGPMRIRDMKRKNRRRYGESVETAVLEFVGYTTRVRNVQSELDIDYEPSLEPK